MSIYLFVGIIFEILKVFAEKRTLENLFGLNNAIGFFFYYDKVLIFALLVIMAFSKAMSMYVEKKNGKKNYSKTVSAGKKKVKSKFEMYFSYFCAIVSVISIIPEGLLVIGAIEDIGALLMPINSTLAAVVALILYVWFIGCSAYILMCVKKQNDPGVDEKSKQEYKKYDKYIENRCGKAFTFSHKVCKSFS